MMPVSRRHVMAAAAAYALAPRFVLAETTPEGFTEIRARIVDATLMGGNSPITKIWSYGAGAAPLVLAGRQGEELKYRFINELDRPINLHWYGVRGPAAAMSINIEPGPDHAVDCVFTPPDAGTFWLGPVADCSRLRDMGLYGLLIVAEKDALTPGFTDVPLVFDDWRLSNDGAIDTSFGALGDAIAQGRLGNWFTVNGAFRPRIAAGAGFLRLRILNAANVRTMTLVFKGADPWIIASDGQPIQPKAIGAKGIELAPGQRADLLVDPAKDEIIMSVDLFEDTVEAGYIERSGAFEPTTLPDNFRLPANPIATSFVKEGATAASLIIEGGEKGGMTGAVYQGERLDLRALLEKGMAWAFNGTAGLPATPWLNVKQGASVILTIDNKTKFDQPLHIQGHVWSLLEDPPGDIWGDTLVALAGKSTQVVFVADNPGDWKLHSTVAERLDTGLITSFKVDPA